MSHLLSFYALSIRFAVLRAGYLQGAIAQPVAGLASSGLARVAINGSLFNTSDSE